MPTPYYEADGVTLHLGDSLTILPTLADGSVDAVVVDPPYEIGIAGRDWDRSGIAFNTGIWAQCLRVLKPGGHLLSFGAPRTYHRMAVAVEDAGLRIVDQLDWIYIHGKPKGTDLARAIDRRRDDREQVLQVTAWLADVVSAAGWTTQRMNDLFGFKGMAGHWVTQGVAATVPTRDQWQELREAIGFDDSEIRPVITELWERKGTVGEAFALREVISEKQERARDTGLYKGYSGHRIKARAASDEARQWEGWNTALKPAHDPILLARKGTGFHTLTANLLQHGVGGLNVVGCPAEGGGWPTNILLGHDCPPGGCLPACPVREMGDAARSFPIFRLNSRTPDAERVQVDGVRHDTPKPLALMRWLLRLVCPPGGTVLDWAAGSGTTLVAARDESMQAIGIELDEAHARICEHRLSQPYSETLFSDIA